MMTYYDCFNGDADGICALTQLRLAEPKQATLVTGVKRDINLLKRVDAEDGDHVTALDISLDKNRADLERILAAGSSVFYCDHHFAGDIPESQALETLISTTPDVCTSLLINQRLDGAYLDWAVAGTFGDNLKRSAELLAKPLELDQYQLTQLENLGIYLNYNGYGASLEDLYYAPAELYRKTVQHRSALAFIAEDVDTFATLEQGYHSDMSNAAASEVVFSCNKVAVYQLPNKAWARRVSGVFGNDLANQHPDRAHAVITERDASSFLVSVRAPLSRKDGADEVCRQFETGGGRAAAAGINVLPSEDIGRFLKVLEAQYS